MNAAARRAASILALVLLVLPLVLTAHFSFARWTRRVASEGFDRRENALLKSADQQP